MLRSSSPELRKSDYYYFFLTFKKEIWEKVGLNRKLVLIEDLTASHSFNPLLMGFLFETNTPGQLPMAKGNLGGTHAEYVSVSENEVALKPLNMTYGEGAAIGLVAVTALQGLRDKWRIKQEQNLLINGASGGVGTYAVQISKSYGTEVTEVCSTKNLELVQSLGADHAIDYNKEDFTKIGQKHDIIFDAVGKNSFSNCKNALTSEGAYVTTAFSPKLLLQMYWTSLTRARLNRSRICSKLK